MSWKTTWWLMGLALGLFSFIFFFERHFSARDQSDSAGPLLPAFNPRQITSIEIIRNPILRVEQKDDFWFLTSPVNYPAQAVRIDYVLNTIKSLKRQPLFSDAELLKKSHPESEFGISPPSASLVLRAKDGRTIQFTIGHRTPLGDQVYSQLVGTPGIFLLDGSFFDRLTASADEWRDRAFLTLNGIHFDRLEVRSGTSSYELQRNTTNQLWQLTKPQPAARADNMRVNLLIQALLGTEVAQFVSDSPKADLESFGLQPPELELAFGQGTNHLLIVQFGNSPTNNPRLAYARRPSTTNIVLVPKTIFDQLHVAPTEFRDRSLISFSTAEIDRIEVQAPENFTLERQTNNLWRILEPFPAGADPELLQEFLATNLAQLEIRKFVKDIVTDFSIYGLAKPAQRYTFRAGGTNSVLGQVDFGTVLQDSIYARRGEESFVYEVGLAEFLKLPAAAYQLRDRRIWNFASSNVTSVTVTQKGLTAKFLRAPNGDWSLAPLFRGKVNPFGPEATMQGLGHLTAVSWVGVGRGDRLPAGYGFAEKAYQISIELTSSVQPSTLSLEFGSLNYRMNPYAATRLNGQRIIFEFPLRLYDEVLRDFTAALSQTEP